MTEYHSAAGSVVEQTINTKSVNPAEVFENAIVGGITSGIFFGVGKAGEAIVNNVKGTVSGKTTTDLIKDASKLVEGKKSQIKAAIEATGRTSPHRLRQFRTIER